MSCCSSFFGRLLLVLVRVEVLTHRCAGQPTLTAPLRGEKRSGEGFPAHREVVTPEAGMQVRSPSGCGAVGIGYDDRVAVRVRAGDHSQ